MAKSELRKLAEQAAYEADADVRQREEQRREQQRSREALVAEQSEAFLGSARTKIKRVLGVSAKDWEVVASHPSYAVLRDPNDDAYHKLTLSVAKVSGHSAKMIIRYTPYEHYGKDYTHNRQGDGLDWHCGPEVTDMLSLGRAIQAHQQHDAKIHASMPDHLP